MDPISHYLSVEVTGVETKKRLHEMQEQMGQEPGIGKATKGKCLHLTLAVLKGFLITCGSIRFMDHNVLVLEIELGKEVCMMLRHLIEIELEPWLADLRFSPHMSIFTNSSVAEKRQLGESL